MSHCVFIYMLVVLKASGSPLIPTNKLSVATWESYHQIDHKGPGTYAFGYDIEDPVTGNVQFKQEERHANGTVTGSYGYVDADGKPFVVTYIADEKGFRTKVEKEGAPIQYLPDSSSFYGNSLERNKKEYLLVNRQPRERPRNKDLNVQTTLKFYPPKLL